MYFNCLIDEHKCQWAESFSIRLNITMQQAKLGGGESLFNE